MIFSGVLVIVVMVAAGIRLFPWLCSILTGCIHVADFSRLKKHLAKHSCTRSSVVINGVHISGFGTAEIFVLGSSGTRWRGFRFHDVGSHGDKEHDRQ